MSRAFGALGTVLSVGALASFAKSGIDAADALNDMSQRLGVSVKDLASFKLAAEQSGTSLESVGKLIQKVSLSVGQAQQGNKAMAAALSELGISADDPKERLLQLADAIEKNGTDTKTLANLQKVAGKSYADNLPLLLQGAQALRDSAAASETYAESMARLAPDADRFNDQLELLKTNAAGASATILSELVPALNEVFERIGLVKDLIGAGGLFNTLVNTAGTSDIGEVMRRVRNEISLTQKAIDGERARGKDASPFEEKLRGLNAQLQILIANRSKALMAPPQTETQRLIKSDRTASGAGSFKPTSAVSTSKSDPQGAFVAKLRDEAATLGMGSEALKKYEAAKLKLTGTNAKLAAGYIAQISAFNEQKAAAEENNKAFDEALKQHDALDDALEGSIKSLREWLAEQEFEASLIGLTNAERQTAIQLRAVEVAGIDTQTEAYKKLKAQILAISETKQLDSLVAGADFSKLKQDQEDMILLAKAFSDGIVQADGSLRKLSETEYLDAVTARLGLANEKIEEMDTFAKKAAENIQQSFADFLFDPFDKGMSGMLKSFGQTIQRMIADAVAADLAKKLFGDLVKGGSGSGVAGGLLSGIGKIFGFADGGIAAYGKPIDLPRFAAGGVSNSAAIFGEARPEAAVPLPDGRSIPVTMKGGGNTIIVNVSGNNNAPDVRRAAGQGAREALGLLSGAQRYA